MVLRAKALALAGLALAACGESPATAPPAVPYADPGFVAAGDIRLHYALTLTSELAPTIARSYGILPRRNLTLLTIAIAPVDTVGVARIAATQLEVVAVTLLGNRRPLSMRRFDEAGGPTYLATVAVRHREPITIEIRARVAASGPEIATRWTREFFLE